MFGRQHIEASGYDWRRNFSNACKKVATKLNYGLILVDWFEIKIWCCFWILKLHAVPSSDAEFSLVEPMSASSTSTNNRQIKFLNHLWKFLFKLQKISNFKIFSGGGEDEIIRIQPYNVILKKLWSNILLCCLIL